MVSSGLVIELSHLSRHFVAGPDVVKAVDDVSLVIPTGAFIGIRGSSGSGKSTLLNLMAGLDQADSGQVVVLGQELGGMSEAQRAALRLAHIGVVFQDNNLIEEFTAIENVMLPLEAAKVKAAQAATEAASALDRVGLGGHRGRYPREMSGGQRQRVGIARALVGQRRLLLADEPTGALDSRNTADLFALLREMADDGVSVVLATHEPTVDTYIDALFEMIDGTLLPAPLPQAALVRASKDA